MKCPKCSSELPDEANFCLKCGQALSASKQHLRPSLIPEAERKRITALFSDLTGYTVMTERLDPEEVKEITSRIFDGIRDVVSKYEGFIERFAGDGVLVLFGVPQVHEDDPIRAVRAAWEIHQYVETLSPRYETKVGRTLSMHSGINTGLAVTGDDDKAKGTYGVTGEAINVAARLSELAGAGEILVGAKTHRASKNHFTFQTLQPRKVRGKSEFIRIYKLVSAKAPASAASRKRKVSSEMVGRDQEMARLESQVIKAINGEGSVVNVIGEAGIGKSRLIAELKRKEVMKPVTLLEGRAISIGKNLSFHPIIDLLKHWAEIIEDDSESEAFDKLENAIRSVHPEETNEILPFIATLMGMKLKERHAERVKGIEGKALEKLIAKNARALIIKGSELTPMVFVMEDLHWADTSSLELLGVLYRLSDRYKLLFINVFRPGYLEREDRKLAAIGEKFSDCFVEIALQPLEKSDSETLVKSILTIKDFPYLLKDQIVDRTGGNPFFIEEVVRSLIDEGAIVRNEKGVFKVTEKIDNVVIPPTINDVLMAKIDRLDEQTRELVKVASVIGRSFFDRIIKNVANSINDMDGRLAYLKDIQLVRGHIRMGELEYLFKHALAQEAAYGSILVRKRKAIHLKVANSIENVFHERLHEFYGMLAYHYTKGEHGEKAEQYMIKAGEEALKSSASSEALYYFQEALQLFLAKYGHDADPEKLANFEKNIALALFHKAQWSEAVKYFGNVLERWEMPLPKRGPLWIVRLIWDLLVILKMAYLWLPLSSKTPSDQDIEAFELHHRVANALGSIDGMRQFQVALAAFRRGTKFDLLKIPKISGTLAGVASVFSGSGLSFKISNKLLEVSLSFTGEKDVRDRMLHSCYSNMILHDQGTWRKIIIPDEEMLYASLGMGDFWAASNNLWFCGLVKSEQGDFGQLMVVIDKLDEIGHVYDYIVAVVLSRGLKADYLLKKRRMHEAVPEIEHAISLTRQENNVVVEMMLTAVKAEAQQLAGDAQGAQKELLQASEIYEKQSRTVLPVHAAPFLVSCFLIALEQLKYRMRSKADPDIDVIRKNAYQAGRAATRNSLKYAPYRTKILRLMGDYHWLVGKQGKALKWWAKAIQEGEKLGARPDLSRTYFKIGKHLLEKHSKYKQLNGIDAKDYLEKARLLFGELSLEQDLEELDKITLNRQA
jgi:class 3 adenylate cyclase/tetratricopeptide (TPR) repeat protein